MDYHKRLTANVGRIPMVIEGGRGVTLETADGQRLMDFFTDTGAYSMGYNTPEIVEALSEFVEGMKRGGTPHQLPDVYPNETRWKCAEMICERVGLDRVFFGNSGAEAVEAAIKMARRHFSDDFPIAPHTSERHMILSMEGGFHGRSGWSLAATDSRGAPYHKDGMGPMPGGFGIVNRDFKLVNRDHRQLEEPEEPIWSRVAALVMAPIMGNGVVRTYPRSFWRRLEELREQHGFLIIFDEVQTSSGRCGYYSAWQSPEIGVRPDIIAMGKGMAMGLPMSATVAREEVAAAFTPGVHFNTTAGSPLVCHVAIRFMEYLDGNLERIRELGQLIRGEIAERAEWMEGEAVGLHASIAPAFDVLPYNAWDFAAECRRRGMILAAFRERGPIMFTPPMVVTREEILEAFRIMDAAHAALVSGEAPLGTERIYR